MDDRFSNAERVEPNLTPILDMVFQLITFFMLVMNAKAATVDMSLKLPVIGSAAPVDPHGADSMLVLNVDKEGKLRVFGREEENVEQYIQGEARAARQYAADHNQTPADGELPVTVVVRADANTPFHLLNRVIRACRDNGYRNFHYRGMSKAQEP